MTFYRAFFRYRIGSFEVIEFAGLRNFSNVLNDIAFQVSFVNSLIVGFVGVLSTVLVALIVAAICNQSFYGNRFLLSLVVITWAIPPIIAGRLWNILLLPNGLFSTFFYYLGLLNQRSYTLLGDPSASLFAVILVSIWKFSPFATLILLGGMKSIPTELYEAAKIDGASPFYTFIHVTVPMILKYFNVAVLFTGIYMAGTVDLVYAVTRGGPGYASEILASYTYKTFFLQQDFGKGSAVAIFLIGWGMLSAVPLLYFIYKQTFGR